MSETPLEQASPVPFYWRARLERDRPVPGPKGTERSTTYASAAGDVHPKVYNMAGAFGVVFRELNTHWPDWTIKSLIVTSHSGKDA